MNPSTLSSPSCPRFAATLVATCVLSLASGADAAGPPAGVQRDWLELDKRMIAHVRSVLPPAPSASAFLARVQPSGGAEKRQLGFGIKRQTTALGGGYMSCNFAVASYDDALLALRVSCWTSTDPKTLEAIRPILEQALGSVFVRDPGSSSVTLSESATYAPPPSAEAAARARLDRDLGSLSAVDTGALSPDLSRAYATLMSPLEELAVGVSCGEGGGAPHGREAANALGAAGRIDLLRNVLRGPNPEGRVYAARALAKLGATSSTDATLIAKIASSSIPIRTCSGCIFSQMPSADAMHAKGE